MTAVWKLPHGFALIDVADSRPTSPPVDALTYGPIGADLIALTQPTSKVITRLGRSLGFEWITSLAWDEPALQRDEPALTLYLREQYGIRPGFAVKPFTVRRGELVRPRHKVLPAELIDEFVASRAGQLAHIGTAIQGAMHPLFEVAQGATWPGPDQDPREWAASRLNALEPAFSFRRMTTVDGSRSFYAIESPDLYTRALREIIELFDQRPPLRICPRCKRLYVPDTAAQKSCRRFTWIARTRELLTTCDPDAPITTHATARRDRQARRTEYKRLEMRARRAIERHGPTDEQAVKARNEFEAWKEANPAASTGRPPKPIPLDIMRDESAR